MGLVERSDMAAGALLEGKIVILVEGSALALIAPKLFQEFLTTCEDSYDNKYLGAFNKVLRLIAILISLCVSSIYVALVAFSTDVMAPEYTLLVAEARSNVPFNSFSEALLIEFMVELIREALIRVPKQVGPAIGIVGALIIGQAAAAAGIFSSLMLIIAALSLLSSFIPPDYTIINPFRVLKFGLLTLTAIFGLFGMTMGLVIITTILVSENSLGVPYMVPYSPFHKKDAIKSIMNNKTISSYRPEFLKTIDKKRIGNLPNVKGKG
jgi:spore germination protein KA/spore germination protein